MYFSDNETKRNPGLNHVRGCGTTLLGGLDLVHASGSKIAFSEKKRDGAAKASRKGKSFRHRSSHLHLAYTRPRFQVDQDCQPV